MRKREAKLRNVTSVPEKGRDVASRPLARRSPPYAPSTVLRSHPFGPCRVGVRVVGCTWSFSAERQSRNDSSDSAGRPPNSPESDAFAERVRHELGPARPGATGGSDPARPQLGTARDLGDRDVEAGGGAVRAEAGACPPTRPGSAGRGGGPPNPSGGGGPPGRRPGTAASTVAAATFENAVRGRCA